jgi:hypothetical protein
VYHQTFSTASKISERLGSSLAISAKRRSVLV